MTNERTKNFWKDQACSKLAIEQFRGGWSAKLPLRNLLFLQGWSQLLLVHFRIALQVTER